MRMYELPVVVNLAREVRVTLVGRLENYLLMVSDWLECAIVLM